MAGHDPLERALGNIREDMLAEQRAAEAGRIEGERRLAESRVRDARGIEEHEVLGRSFVVRARQAGIKPETVVFRVEKSGGIFRKGARWHNEKRRAWVVTHYNNGPAGYGLETPGIYILESGEIYASLKADSRRSADVDYTAEACARYLAQRGAVGMPKPSP